MSMMKNEVSEFSELIKEILTRWGRKYLMGGGMKFKICIYYYNIIYNI